MKCLHSMKIRSNARIVRGTPGDDVIIGGSASQIILGGGGNDVIIGGGGSDRIHGGRGNDRINGGRGNDRLSGGGGNDRLAGEIGDDRLNGGAGRDHHAGGMGIDILKGGRGRDVLRGDAGPDFIDGGRDDDTVSFVTQPAASGGVRVEKNQPSKWKDTFEGVRYPGSAYGGSRAGGGSGVDGLKSVENVVGAERVSPGFEQVEAGPRRDRLVDVFESKLTGGVTITVNGGAGNDDVTVSRKGSTVIVTANGRTQRIRVKGDLDAVQVDGNDGNDKLRVRGFGAGVPVTISGGNGNDRLVGGRGNDVLNDGAGNDVLIGNGGDDGLTNGAGRDRLSGGNGSDLLVSSSIDAGDVLDGGAQADNVSFAQVGDAFAVRAELGGLASRIGRPGAKARIVNAEDLEGTERDDVLIGDGRDNKLLGRGGRDTLLGRDGDDRLDALYHDADRRLDGGRGDDTATVDGPDRRVLRGVEKTRRRTAVITET